MSVLQRYFGIIHSKTCRIYPVLLLSLAIICIYLPEILSHELVNWDDADYISNNEFIKEFTFNNISAVFKESYASNYAPLHLISYMIDYFFWGEWAQVYLLENLLIHWINSLLIYTMVARITGSKLGAFFGTLIFLIHPVQVESVAWATERKNVLSMLFFLAALHFYLQYDSSTHARKWSAYLLSVFLFACAILTKSITVIFPAVLLLHDYTISNNSVRTWKLLEKVPFFILSMAGILLTLLAQNPELHQGRGGMFDLFQGDKVANALTMATVFITYLRMLVLPSGLNVLYSPTIITSIDATIFLSIAGLACFFLLLAYAWRKDEKFAFWGGVFFLGLLPVSQIVPLTTLMNDRYLYFPMIGIAGVIALAYERMTSWRPKTAYCLIPALLAFSLYLAHGSATRLTVWKNSTTLWSDSVRVNPSLATAWIMLGEAQMTTGNYAASHISLNKAVALLPGSYVTLYALARLAATEGNEDLAVSLLEKAVRTGYKNKSFLENDATFASLHDNPKFIKLCNYFYLLYYMPDYRTRSNKPFISS